MKKLSFVFLLAIFNFSANLAWSQSAFNAGSHSAQFGDQIYEYSIGEMTLVSTIESPKMILTQGFLQPHLIIEQVVENGQQPHADLEDNIKVYPNPTENMLNIELTSGSASFLSYQLFDGTGRLIINKYEQQVEGINHFKLDVSSFAAGAYFLVIKKEDASKNIGTYTYKIEKIQ